MTRVAYPYLTIGSDSLEPTVWELISKDGKRIPLQRYVEDWDYQEDFTIFKSIKVDREIAAVQLEIAERDLDLKLMFRIGTGPGNMPREWVYQTIIEESDESGLYIVKENVSGRKLSNRMMFETILFLATDQRGASQLSPRFAGAKVWEQKHDVALEGSEPRFPMETVSFSKRFPGTNISAAPWHLHWSPGAITRDFGGSVRLYINSDNDAFLDQLNQSDPLTMQSLMAGVMNQMIVGLLQQSDIEEQLEGCDEGSVGGYVRQWLSIAFPGETVTSVRSKLEFRPGDFYSSILSAAEFGASNL